MLKGKIALITGGAGHLGKEIARDMLTHGATVILLDKDEKRTQTAVRELSSSSEGLVHLVTVDLENPDEIRGISAKLQGLNLRPNVIVNNAAFYDEMPGWGVPFGQEGFDAWTRVFQVNTAAPFFIVQSLADLLRHGDDPSVINISSIYSLTGPDHRLYDGTQMTNPCAYAASKAALNQVTRWLSTTLAPEIRFNSVTVGGIARGQPKSFVKAYQARTPLKRMAKESDVSGAVSFLASSRASYITGQNLIIDGGWTAW